MTKPLDDYVEVAERIEKFYERYPEGSLRCKEIRSIDVGDEHFLVYVAQAFRTADDEAPAEGSAWEPVPGKTNFTRDSELMNAETSAWGRAIAALGFEVKRGIASRQEVQNRRNGAAGGSTDIGADDGASHPPNEGAAASSVAISDKQKSFLERLLKEKGADSEQTQLIIGWASEKLTGERGGGASKAIDGLKGDSPDETLERLLKAALAWQRTQSDIPADTTGLDEGEKALDDIPF